MNLIRIITSTQMILKMLFRRRIVIILLLVIPAFFLGIVELTTSEHGLLFKLASLSEEPIVPVSLKQISHVFFSVACVGFLVSFLALYLIQKNTRANRRLIICGYHPTELLLANFAALVFVIIVIGFYVGGIANAFVKISHTWLFIFGLVLTGLVYGSYGLLVGSLVKGELEGILLIVLLVNIDAGWLQNPLFYAEAQNQVIIRYLPAFFPSQASIIAAFTEYSIWPATIGSLVYGFVLLIITSAIFYLRMQVRKN